MRPKYKAMYEKEKALREEYERIEPKVVEILAERKRRMKQFAIDMEKAMLF